jgi:hypothetical protein
MSTEKMYHVRARSSLALALATGVATLAGAILMTPAIAEAQAPVSPGTLSISFGLQSAPEAGLWFTATSHTRIGLIGTLERRSSEIDGPEGASDSETWLRYSAGPALRWYLSGNSQRVAPFWYVAGTAGVDDPPTNERTTSYEANLGFGVDWSPVQHVSFGGTTGFAFNHDRTKDGDIRRSDSTLRTLTAGLQMQIHF